MTSIGVYAVVLGGLVERLELPAARLHPLDAQMISYEVAMGLALVAVLLYSGHLRMTEIVAAAGHDLERRSRSSRRSSSS